MANIEISTLTRNNDGNTYIIKDANAIPKTGSNAISGDLIPATDNAYDLGSTTKNLKVIYSRKIVGNGDSLDICSYALGQGAYIALDKNDTQFDGAFRIYTGTSSYKLQGSRTGTLSWSGTSIFPTSDNTCDLGSSTYGFANFYTNKIYLKDSTIFKLVDDSFICLGGATAQANGANLVLNGKNRSTSTGEFKLEARDGTNTKQLIGKPDGTLSWNGNTYTNSITSKDTRINKSTLPSVNVYRTLISYEDSVGNNIGGLYAVTLSNGESSLSLVARSYFNSSYCGLYVMSDASDVKRIIAESAQLAPQTDGFTILGGSDRRWKEIWCIQSSINSSSDERQKQQIKPIDNDLLDAWENVNPIQFKWNDAVKEKGDNARVHTGYIAQNIQQALTENGVNPNDYGLFLYDEWGEEQEEKDEQGNIIKPYKPSGNAYGLRYTEALIVECAYLRRENSRLKERLSKIEKLLNI